MTSIKACKDLPALKYCIALDPFFYGFHDEVKSGEYKIEQPVCIIHTEYFYQSKGPNKNHDAYSAMTKFFDNCTNKEGSRGK